MKIRHFLSAIMLAVLMAYQYLPAQPEQGVVHVMLFMHNEDSALGDLEAPGTRDRYAQLRNGLVDFINMLHGYNLPFCWQSDWKFLQGVIKFETPALMTNTNNKNLVRWMSEDMGVSVDPHSHEHYGYNYADVAHLMDSLGVTPTAVIGGHIYDPYSDKFQNWERFRTPLQGSKYPWAWWRGSILMGSGTPSHTYDPAPSGVWRPKNAYDYWSDDPEGDIVCVGQYTGSVAGVSELVNLYKTGAIAADKMLTASIYKGQSFPPGNVAAYQDSVVKPLLEMQQRGEVKIVDFVEAVEIWKNEYGASAFVYNAPEMLADTVTTHIASSAGGVEGILVQIAVPATARFGDRGAPIVVHVPGGWNGFGLEAGTANWPLNDFIEIRFNFPGSGRPGQMSGGLYDQRGENCIQALSDVGRFALGEMPDISGKYLHDFCGSIKPMYGNVGFCGWSNGGNATISAAGAHVDVLSNLAWIVNWESPVGDGMPNVEAGGAMNPGNPGTNFAYDPDTGQWRLDLLRYSAALTIKNKDTNASYTGGFYFDNNGNNLPDETIDFIIQPSYYQDKAFFSVRVRTAAESAGILPATLPPHLPTLQETKQYWLYRNGENWIDEAVAGNSRLMFMVEASIQDHVQGALDHPHILIQYEGFRARGARFVRLNPDRSYVEALMDESKPSAADNDAYALFDHISIRQALQPAGMGGVSSTIGVAAAIAELADRTADNNLSIQLGTAPTGIDAGVNPEKYITLANFPNPFNPATTICYSISQPGFVRLTLYDAIGRTAAVLVAGEQMPGAYSLRFDAGTAANGPLPSGVYFLQLRTQEGISQHRILLTK